MQLCVCVIRVKPVLCSNYNNLYEVIERLGKQKTVVWCVFARMLSQNRAETLINALGVYSSQNNSIMTFCK